MRVLGELNPKDLPHPIPADQLQVILGPNQAFCSWDDSISKVSEEMARWPFLVFQVSRASRRKVKNAQAQRGRHPLYVIKDITKAHNH